MAPRSVFPALYRGGHVDRDRGSALIWLIVIGLAAAGLATLAVSTLVQPIMDGRMLWQPLGSAVLGGLSTIGVGVAFDVAPAEYLIGISAFAVPVLVLMEAAAACSGAHRTGRWILLLAWGGVVFPLAALVPLWLTASCAGADCQLEDFGGALPLLVSSSAFVTLAWLPAGVTGRADVETHSPRRVTGALLVLWLAVILWLVPLEGAIDQFTPLIVIAAVVGPVAGALGWLVTDRARSVAHSMPRSAVLGMIAGIAAMMPGVVTVTFPWSLAVGALAGALGSLAYSSRASVSAGVATRWGLVVLVAAAVGFLAPAISGNGVGILFSAQLDVLAVPVMSFAGVTVGAVVLSAPAWVLLRRNADRGPASKESPT